MTSALAATTLMTVVTAFPQISAADGFTGSAFGKWPGTSQDGYIQSSIMMAGVIGAQVKPSVARCIDAWYFADDASKARVNDDVRNTITKFPDHHPSGVILAVIQKKCGAFKH